MAPAEPVTRRKWRTLIRRHSVFIGGITIYLSCAMIGSLLFMWKGHDLIQRFVTSDETRSLEYYHQRAGSILRGIWLMGAMMPVIYLVANTGYVLVALVLGDVFCLVLSEMSKGPFSIDRDWSVPEVYQYGKEIAMVWLLVAAWRLSRRPTLLCLALIFLFFLVDDSLKFHERTAHLILHVWPSMPAELGGLHLEQKSIGEALSLVIPASVLATLLLVAYVRDDTTGRAICRIFLGLILLLAVCGVVIDMLVKPISPEGYYPLLTIAEDWGEMLVMSLMLAYTLNVRNKVTHKAGGLPLN